MKKLMMFCIGAFLCLGLVACSDDSEKKEEKPLKVGLVQLMDHTSLNTIRDSILDEFKAQGYVDGENIKIQYQNAGGDIPSLDTICKQFEADKVDVIIAITTPAAQAAAKYAENIPVVFSAVSDVKASKLVNDLKKPDLNITGTSDEIQVSSIMDLAFEMYPETKSVGYLYNASEVNSAANLKKLETYAKQKGFKVNKAAVANAADIQTGLASLLDSSDIIFSPTDNTVASAMGLVSEMCNNAKKPFFTGADSMVQDGGLATIGINYEQLGEESAEMAIKILKGTSVKDIPVKIYKDDLNLYMNTTTASKINYTKIEDLKANYNVVTFE